MNMLPSQDWSSDLASLTASRQGKVRALMSELKHENAMSEVYRARRREALLEIAGSVSHEDIASMMAAIDPVAVDGNSDSR